MKKDAKLLKTDMKECFEEVVTKWRGEIGTL